MSETSLKPLPQKKKDDQDAPDRRSKRGKKKYRKQNNEAPANIDIRYRGTDGRKPPSEKSQGQCSLTLDRGESVWNPTKNVAESLFPNAEAVVNEAPTEEEMIAQAILESIETLHEKCVIDAIPDNEAPEKCVNKSDDEDAWGRVHRNLPTPEPEKDAKASDANNNSGSLGTIENLTVPPVKLQTRHGDITLRNVGDEPLVPIVTPKFIDKYGRVDGYTEKRLFMGKGARFKQEEYLKQQQQQLLQLEPPISHPQYASSANSCTDLRASVSSTNSCQDLRASGSSANSCQNLRASVSSANSCQDLRSSAENASVVQDFIAAAAQNLQTNATNGTLSQDPAIITTQFPTGSTEMLHENSAEPSAELPKVSDESSVSARQVDNPAEQIGAPEASEVPEAPPVVQQPIQPLMQRITLKPEVEEFFPKNYVHPTVQPSEFPVSSQSYAGLANQSANLPEKTRDSSRPDFEAQTRQIAAGPSSDHQVPRHPNYGQTANRGGYHDGDNRNTGKFARESYGGFGRGSRPEQSGGRNHGRTSRNSHGGARGDRRPNEPNPRYENPNREDHRVARHEQNPYKYENPNREDHRVARHEQNPYKYENPNRDDHRGDRHEQNSRKYAGPDRDGPRSARPEQSQRYDDREGQRGSRGPDNREVQKRSTEQPNRNVQSRPNEQNRGNQPRPVLPQNREIPWGPAEKDPGHPGEASRVNSNINYARVVSQNVQPNIPAVAKSAAEAPIGQPKIAESQEKIEGSVVPGEAKEPREAANVNVAEPPPPFSSFNSRHTTAQIHELAAELPPTPPNLISPRDMTTPDVHTATIPPPNPFVHSASNSSVHSAPNSSVHSAPNSAIHSALIPPPNSSAHSALIPPPNSSVQSALLPTPNSTVHPSLLPPPNSTIHPSLFPASMSSAPPFFVSPMETTTPARPSSMPPPPPPPNSSVLAQPSCRNETNDAARVTNETSMIPPLFSVPPPGFHAPPRSAAQPCAICAHCANRANFEATASLESRHESLRRNDPLLYKLLIDQREVVDPRSFSQPPDANANETPTRCSCDPRVPANPTEPKTTATAEHQRAEDQDGQARWARPQNAQQFAPGNPYLPAQYPEAASLQRRGGSECVAGQPPYSGNTFHENAMVAGRPVDSFRENATFAGRPVESFPENATFAGRPVESFPENTAFAGRPVDGFPENAAFAGRPVDGFPESAAFAGRPVDGFPENAAFVGRPVDGFPENAAFVGRPIHPFPENPTYCPASRTYKGFPQSANFLGQPDECLRYAHANFAQHSAAYQKLPIMQMQEMQRRLMQQQWQLDRMRQLFGDEPEAPPESFPAPIPPHYFGYMDTGNHEANHQPPPPPPAPVSSTVYAEIPPPATPNEAQLAARVANVTPMAIVGRRRGRLDPMTQKN